MNTVGGHSETRLSYGEVPYRVAYDGEHSLSAFIN